jgi:hypothetical protein
MNVCRVCRRTARGFAYRDIAACSLAHARILQGTQGMIDPDQYESDALGVAGERGGEYLDSIGKTDLATMTEEEWQALIAVICGGYVERMGEIAQSFVQAADTINRKVGHDRVA